MPNLKIKSSLIKGINKLVVLQFRSFVQTLVWAGGLNLNKYPKLKFGLLKTEAIIAGLPIRLILFKIFWECNLNLMSVKIYKTIKINEL